MGHVDFHVLPGEVLFGLVPGVHHQLQASVEEPARIGEHAFMVSHAEAVMLSGCPGDPADDAMTLRVRISRADHGGGCSASEGQRGEFHHEVIACDDILHGADALDRGVLDLARVLPIDDQHVFGLTCIDHRAGQRHGVNEAQTGVRDIEVHGRTGKSQIVVDSDGH